MNEHFVVLNEEALNPLSRTLQWAIAIFGILAPLALIAYAFADSTDPVTRARTVVDGCEALVLVLVGACVLEWLYRLGYRSGLRERQDALPATA